MCVCVCVCSEPDPVASLSLPPSLPPPLPPGEDDKLILCDECNKAFHLFCLRPVLHTIPEGEWLCPACQPTVARRCTRGRYAIRPATHTPPPPKHRRRPTELLKPQCSSPRPVGRSVCRLSLCATAPDFTNLLISLI